ncbi:MFS transporter [Rhodococcus erythropolis]|uniref:MFS transporter n=1 Tax=Rhodococcus erythropolis TaxID=1833 RepID=UPI0024B81410|nr:MFS transporter [Rhodococcus erythropolis]MDJ0015076.1 MFS transporter [Rhodococcus erythropolis]
MRVERLMRWRTLRPLHHRDYRLLLSTVGLSLFATGMWTIVMVFQVFAIDDSPLVLSAVATGLSLGLFAFAILGGVIADRFSKRVVIMSVQGANTVALTAVAVLSLAGLVELWHLAAASFVIGAGSAFFYPAYSAYLPQVLEAEELLAANGLEGAVRPTVQQGLGPALGGLIVGAFFPAAGAAVVAVSFGAAFIVTLFLSRREPFIDEAVEVQVQSVLADLREGVRYVVTTRWLWWTLLFGSTLALVIQGPIEVLLPFLTRERFSNPELSFGLLLAAYGIGGAVGSLVVSSWRLPRRYLTVMLLFWGGGALPLVLLGLSDSFTIMAAALFLVGGTSGAGIVIWGTLLQRRVPANMIGRVASLDFFVSIAFMPISIAIAGPLSLVLPAETIFVIAGLVPPALAVLAITAGRMRTDEMAHPLDKT